MAGVGCRGARVGTGGTATRCLRRHGGSRWDGEAGRGGTGGDGWGAWCGGGRRWGSWGWWRTATRRVGWDARRPSETSRLHPRQELLPSSHHGAPQPSLATATAGCTRAHAQRVGARGTAGWCGRQQYLRSVQPVDPVRPFFSSTMKQQARTGVGSVRGGRVRQRVRQCASGGRRSPSVVSIWGRGVYTGGRSRNGAAAASSSIELRMS